MELIEFLEKYKGGREAEALKILEKDFLVWGTVLNGKVLLKYDRMADKSIPIVQESRGIILSVNNFEVISIPLRKFGNHGEAYAPTDLDITKCRILEKCDGSCFGLYWDQFNEKWYVQTMGQVEAEKTMRGFGIGTQFTDTWATLFWNTFHKYTEKDTLEKLDKDWTYIFELCTPWNKVVVTHSEPKLYFLAMRNKKTFQEDWTENSILYDIFDKPKVYNHTNIDEVLKIAKEQLSKEDEGFILVDENFRRVKIKSAQYVAEHYHSTTVTLESIAQVVFLNEQDEWLLTFPEYKDVIDIMTSEINRLGKQIDDYLELCNSKLQVKTDRKELSYIVKNTPASKVAHHYIYALWKGEFKNGAEALRHFKKQEELVKKVRIFLEESDVHKLVEHNPHTKSLR
jgi:hypothetical protein